MGVRSPVKQRPPMCLSSGNLGHRCERLHYGFIYAVRIAKIGRHDVARSSKMLLDSYPVAEFVHENDLQVHGYITVTEQWPLCSVLNKLVAGGVHFHEELIGFTADDIIVRTTRRVTIDNLDLQISPGGMRQLRVDWTVEC